jgi:hypothetical protein
MDGKERKKLHTCCRNGQQIINKVNLSLDETAVPEAVSISEARSYLGILLSLLSLQRHSEETACTRISGAMYN